MMWSQDICGIGHKSCMTLESNIDYNLGVRAHLGDLGCCNLPEKFRIETKEANHIISLLTHRPTDDCVSRPNPLTNASHLSVFTNLKKNVPERSFSFIVIPTNLEIIHYACLKKVNFPCRWTRNRTNILLDFWFFNISLLTFKWIIKLFRMIDAFGFSSSVAENQYISQASGRAPEG